MPNYKNSGRRELQVNSRDQQCHQTPSINWSSCSQVDFLPLVISPDGSSTVTTMPSNIILFLQNCFQKVEGGRQQGWRRHDNGFQQFEGLKCGRVAKFL